MLFKIRAYSNRDSHIHDMRIFVFLIIALNEQHLQVLGNAKKNR